MISKIVKKITLIFVAIGVIIGVGFIWYDGGFMMVDQPSRVDEISIYNSIYMLENGDTIRQRFVPRQEYLNALDLMMVNTSENSTGELIVQILDMWGEPLKEVRYNLAEIEPGVYEKVELDLALPVEENEEFQICMYQVNANEIPGVVVVPYDAGVAENGICYFNDEIIEENGLVIGYVYGNREFVGYEYQERAVITMAVIKTIVVVLLGVVCIAVVYLFKPKAIKGMLRNYQMFYQLSVITVLFSIFLLCALINKCVVEVMIPPGVYLFFGITLLLLLWTTFLYMRSRDGKRKKRMKKIERYCVLFLGIISVLLRLPMFTHIQRWDSSIYYTQLHNASVNFDFTFRSVWENFKLAEHPTFSYSFFMLMGEFLFPGKVTGVLLVHLVLTVAGIMCIYALFRKYWCCMAPVPATIFTFIISVTPLFLGTFSYVNVDYTLVLFFVFLLYAVHKKKMILAAFWTMAVMLNKETGWVIIAGYYLGYFISLWLEGKDESFKEKVKKLSKNKMLYIIVAGAVVLGFYMIMQGGISGWFAFGKYSSIFVTAEDIAEKGWFANGIGIFPRYILHRLGQMFVVNFLWIPTLIIIVSCIILFRSKGKMWGKGIHNLSGMICSLVLFALFSVLYITAALVRYTIFSSVIWWILALLLLYYVIAPLLRAEVLTIGLGTVAIILLVQNVAFIDPISNLLYVKLDSGKGTILSTELDSGYFGDTLINNYRFSYLDDLLDEMLEEVSYSENMYIYQYDDETQIRGIGTFPHGWDAEKQERRYVSEDANRRYGALAPLNVLNIVDVESIPKEWIPQNAIVYFVPYCNEGEQEALDVLRAYYQIGEKTEVSNWGGSLYYYVLEKI